MSSILKALKKLEHEATAPGEMTGRPGPGSAPARPRYVLYTSIVIGVILAVGVFLWIRYQPSVLTARTAEDAAPHQSLRTSVEKKQMPVPTAAPDDPETDDPDMDKPIERQSPDQPPTADKEKPVKKESPVEVAAETNDAASKQAPQDPVKSESPEQAEAKTKTAPANTNLQAPPAAEEPETPPQPAEIPSGAADTPILEDIGLEIQAISWDQTPSRRIAVINSRLCREGERINGFRILKINPDDIVVSNGKTTGTLIFRFN